MHCKSSIYKYSSEKSLHSILFISYLMVIYVASPKLGGRDSVHCMQECSDMPLSSSSSVGLLWKFMFIRVLLYVLLGLSKACHPSIFFGLGSSHAKSERCMLSDKQHAITIDESFRHVMSFCLYMDNSMLQTPVTPLTGCSLQPWEDAPPALLLFIIVDYCGFVISSTSKNKMIIPF